MPRRKPTPDDIEHRQVVAKEWFEFRRDFKFSQKKLAETIGKSRRTVQMVESGTISPHPETLKRFDALKQKHVNESKNKIFV